ncbi:hypothetical protein K1X76_06320 [bacterium]|nr:hypothetical protein [bacterium]
MGANSTYLYIRTDIEKFNNVSSYKVVKDNGIKGILDDEDVVQDDRATRAPVTFERATQAREEWQAIVAGKFAERSQMLITAVTGIRNDLAVFESNHPMNNSCNSLKKAADDLEKITTAIEQTHRLVTNIRDRFGQAYVNQFEREQESVYDELEELESQRLALARQWDKVQTKTVSVFSSEKWWWVNTTLSQECDVSVRVNLQL